MQTIVVISTCSIWAASKIKGSYTKSTIDSELSDIGFIHCTLPDQTIATARRHFIDHDDIVLLLIDVSKLTAPLKLEKALSGRPGLFPHIYGALNTDAVYKMIPLDRTSDGQFVEPNALKAAKYVN